MCTALAVDEQYPLNNPLSSRLLYAALAAFALLTTFGAAASFVPLYDITPCPVTAVPAECGTAILPAERGDHHYRGGEVHIPVVRLGSGNGIPAVVLGGGGPGGGLYLDEEESLRHWNDYRKRILGEDGTLILIDQRGAGLSRPLLNCPEEKALYTTLLQHPLPLRQEAAQYADLLRQCLQRLQANGVPVSAFTTTAAADDVEDIRTLLNIEQWHLIGFSYGTRLALEVLRHHPHGVASAVLDSPVPYDARQHPPAYLFSDALQRISTHCAQQEACQRHGNVQGNLARALTLAAATPLTLRVQYNSTLHTLALPPHRLLDVLHFGLFDEVAVAVLPFFSRQLAQGDVDNENARYFARIYLSFYFDETWASMLNFFINCHERAFWLPPVPPQNGIQEHEYNSLQALQQVCKSVWEDAATATAPAAVSTDKPVLVINGIYDPATPVHWGRVLARRLPNARHLAAAASHTPSIYVPCVQEGIFSFFQSASATIPVHCGDETLSFY